MILLPKYAPFVNISQKLMEVDGLKFQFKKLIQK